MKPDILMIALLLLVILVSLRLIDGIGWRRVILAGALVGLTTAAKQYGVVAAIPLAAAILFSVQSWGRRLLLFGAAPDRLHVGPGAGAKLGGEDQSDGVVELVATGVFVGVVVGRGLFC